jgi:Flp pilus assembly protein TadG
MNRAGRRAQSGSAAIESVFAMVVLMFLVLGVVEVGFALYARNMIASAAHEGARAAIELGRDVDDARAVARSSVANATGRLVEDPDVRVLTRTRGDDLLVTVTVSGRLKLIGPVPWSPTVSARATALRETAP